MDRKFIALVIFSSLILFATAQINVSTTPLNSWAFDALNTPQLSSSSSTEVIVAVIDDGFMLNHNGLKDYLFTNNNEIPRNNIDDDHNGYIDDYCGWDIADNDADVNIPRNEYEKFYHGTFIASLITQIANRCFTDSNIKHIKILPIKVLSDHSGSTNMGKGYQGIEYAIQMKADIICCAWSGGQASAEDIKMIKQALEKNILIIAAAGNTYREEITPPASITGVYAITSLDTCLRKRDNSNYGQKIDLALPGERIKAAYPQANNAWFYGEGTSAATGLTVGCAAVLKSLSPNSMPWEIMEALKNTTTPIDSINIRYCGKLGSGIPNLEKAIDYMLNSTNRYKYFNPNRPKGVIYLSKENDCPNWDIHPTGAYKSIIITPDKIDKKDFEKEIGFYKYDSLFTQVKLQNIRAGISIPGSCVTIKVNSFKKKDFPDKLKLNYHVETIDSTKLYCSNKIYLNQNHGQITDNSGNANYANYCSCSWQITVPDYKRIHFYFTEFDTEAKVDFVYLFDGEYSIPDYTVAKFSGSAVPPSVTSRTNSVLVWFVTDGTHTGKGWTLHFEGVD